MQRVVVSATAVPSTNAGETILATLGPVPVSGEATGLLPSHLVISAFINFTAGASTTAVVVRIRRGTTVAGAVVGVAGTYPLAAAAIGSIAHEADDPIVSATPPTVPGQQYVVTIQQTGGTGAGTANYVCATTTMS